MNSRAVRNVGRVVNLKRLAVVLYLVMWVLPFIISKYHVQLLTFILINALFAQSFNLMFGYGGKLSFGHAAFFGVGAYTVGIMLVKASAPFWLSMVTGVAISALMALVIGYFCIRRMGYYFAILTTAFGQLLFVIVDKWGSLTGGYDGLQGIYPPSLIGSIQTYYFYVLIMVTVSLGIIYGVVASPFGYTLRAIRDNATRTEFNGVNIKKLQLVAFTLSGTFGGLSGCLFAPFNCSLAPALLDWTKSADPIIMTIIGGQSTFYGPILGAAVFAILQSILLDFTVYWPFVIGSLLVIIILFLPSGLTGVFSKKRYGWRDYVL
jgi:branched-chain amino acid transport system permease protein